MFIQYRSDGKWKEAASLTEALHITQTDPPVIAIVGGGGKTTTIRRLAQEYERQGQPVILTTTTHVKAESQPWVLTEDTQESWERAREILKRYGKVSIGLPAEDGKMKRPSGRMEEKIFRSGLPVLIEADGAKWRPLKAPAAHEPVIPEQTTHVICVYGTDALGRPIAEVGFRIPEILRILREEGGMQAGVDTLVTPGILAVLADSQSGGRKGCPAHAQYSVILNKADQNPDCARSTALALSERGIRNVLITGEGELDKR